MHLITPQEKANAQQRDARTHKHSLTRAGVLLGASINMRTSKERQTENGSTHDIVFTCVNNYGGKNTRTQH